MMDERLDQMPADARDDALAYGREREQERLECWRAQIGDSDAVMYLRTRGVSLDTARKWGLGYDRERKRLVIPYVGSEYFHVDRDITGGAEEKYTVPSTDELGSLPLYNPSAFDSPAFYVVEGPLDALAILDEGKPAVALCGTNYEEVVAASVSRGYRGTIIAALDSDAEGRKAQERFMLALKQSGLYGVEFSYHRGAKDAAEARCIEPVQFSVDIARAYEKAVQTRREKLLGSYHEALRHLRVQGPGDVLRGICFNEDSVHPVPTGFRQLDHWLGGGLMPGLYLVGSAATVGKTSLCLQIADQIAEAGHPVMFVSVVQRANELIAKSIARYLYRERPERGAQPLSPNEILDCRRRSNWNGAQSGSVIEISRWYLSHIAPYLRLAEGTGRPSVADIRSASELMSEKYGGTMPVIIIDYLQLIANDSDEVGRLMLLKSTLGLRQLARDLRTPVLAISSVKPGVEADNVEMLSFANADIMADISDVIIALERSRRPESLENGLACYHCGLQVLKNRTGKTTAHAKELPLSYFPQVSTFAEATLAPTSGSFGFCDAR